MVIVRIRFQIIPASYKWCQGTRNIKLMNLTISQNLVELTLSNISVGAFFPKEYQTTYSEQCEGKKKNCRTELVKEHRSVRTVQENSAQEQPIRCQHHQSEIPFHIDR